VTVVVVVVVGLLQDVLQVALGLLQDVLQVARAAR